MEYSKIFNKYKIIKLMLDITIIYTVKNLFPYIQTVLFNTDKEGLFNTKK